MGKSSQEKIAFAKTLIEGGISYREIQNLLQNRIIAQQTVISTAEYMK